jgi:hypothetical protein
MWALSDTIATALMLAALAISTRVHRTHPGERVAIPPSAVEWAAGLVAASAVLIRYGGIAAAVGVCAISIDLGRGWRSKLATAARTISPSLIAIVAVLAVGAARAADSARPLAWHPLEMVDLTRLEMIFGWWLTGNQSTSVMRTATVVIVVSMIGSVVFFIRRSNRREDPDRGRDAAAPRDELAPARCAIGLAIVVASQIAVLAVTASLLDDDVSFDQRLMLPAQLVVTILLTAAIGRVARTRTIRGSVGALILGMFVLTRITIAVGPFPEGLGVPTPPDHYAYIDVVDAFDRDVTIATNVPEILWRQTGRASIRTPSEYDILSGEPNDTFADQVVMLGSLVGARDGVLVLQNNDSRRVLGPAQVAKLLPCAAELYRDADGVLFDLRPCAQ